MSFSEVSYVTTLYYVSYYKFVILYDFVKRKFTVNKLNALREKNNLILKKMIFSSCLSES